MKLCEAVIFAVELGVAISTTPSVELQGRDPLGLARLTAECGRIRLEYEHQSSIPDGSPINSNKDQRQQERLSIIYKYQIN